MEPGEENFDVIKTFQILGILIKERNELPPMVEEKEIETTLISEAKAGDKKNVDSYFAHEEKDKINIDNAGLILFHPYLLYVFKELKWTSGENKFISPKTRQKAVLFLQYLINQKSRQPEHELVLNKILCGWKLNRPIKTSCNFSPKEKQAAAELNETLREHWPALKTTSAQGLVKSFIERKGAIEREEKSFLVRVEKKSIDILMQNLPFGIQTIKLPWNEYIIHTEWGY